MWPLSSFQTMMVSFRKLTFLICGLFLTAVEVSLNIDSFEVDEGVSVSVCVSLSNEIERDVEVMVATQNGSAFGKISLVK